jgi:outer membrane murein-binding lipoprotein Lpp
MKPTWRWLVLAAVILSSPSLAGCREEEKKLTPQKTEELRQREIDRAKAFQKEG